MNKDEDVLANPSTAIEHERAIQRYGADLYRLALLLGNTPTTAAQALLAATRQLATAETPPHESALIAALLAALPREAPAWWRPRAPAWINPPGQRAEHPALLRRLARLPRSAKLALGLTALRAYEPEQIAPLLATDEQQVREQIRDALRALAPHTEIAAPAPADASEVPEACRPTRTALELADPRLHTDSAIRGHLALCSACRAAEQQWAELRDRIETALRGTLREIRLSNVLDEQLRAATKPALARTERNWIENARFRLAFVIVPVLALIAFVVWPRGAEPSLTNGRGTPSAAQSQDPHELVRRTQVQLYAPTEGSGVWHGRYAIQWSFPDGSFALLNADEWLDAANGRHRLQLVHHSGGGPFEYQLTNGTQALWYAVGQTYAGSIYPLNTNGSIYGARFQITPAQRDELFQARLTSGAWDIAAKYLQQATTANLRAWGRQRDADGRLLALFSFAGTSPLALPPDAPTATTSQITILLAIDEASGRLREVREIFGAEGTEQTARTTWRVLNEEWIADAEAANRLFDHDTAWNGIGEFPELGAPLSARLPLVRENTVGAPTMLLRIDQRAIWMPKAAPTGTASALLVNQMPGDLGLGIGANILTLIYNGTDRQVTIRTLPADAQDFALNRAESRQINGHPAILQPLPAQGYLAVLFRSNLDSEESFVTQVRTTGYTRAELIGLLESLGPPTLAAVHAQAPLFTEQQPHDETWRAVIGALAEPPEPPAGGARHFVEQVFKRHAPVQDDLPDPYHRPPYAGWPERYIQDNWARGSASLGTYETAATMRDAAGKIYARQYRSATAGWDYDARASRVTINSGSVLDLVLNEDQLTVLQMINCGGVVLERAPDGTHMLVLSEPDWSTSCQNPRYISLWDMQKGNNGAISQVGEAPYLADLKVDTLTTVVKLGADGRPARTEVWAGGRESGVLLESWERVSEELIAADRLPADSLNPQPPASDIRLILPTSDVIQGIDTSLFGATALDEAIQGARAPFYGFGQAPGAPQPASIIAGTQPEQLMTTWLMIDSSVFNAALNNGYASYSTYTITTEAGLQPLSFYQGAAKELGAFLRDAAEWSSSAATDVQAAGAAHPGWLVTDERSGITWLLFELDDTLIAVANPTGDTLAALDKLQQLN